MSLFNDFFGKEENNQLKKQLNEKTRQIEGMESAIAEVRLTTSALASELERLRRSFQVKSEELNTVTNTLNSLKSDYAKTTRNFKELERTSADQLIHANGTIKSLQLALKQCKPEILAAQAERDAKTLELQDLKAVFYQKEKKLIEREAKFEEKSAIFIKEKEILQQKSSELDSKEQHWNINIQPDLLKYERHLSLDLREKYAADFQNNLEKQQANLNAREADMIRRQSDDKSLRVREIEISHKEQVLTNRGIELEAKASELDSQRLSSEDRTRKLEQWAYELFEFRNRVAQLDDEISDQKKRNELILNKEKESKDLHSQRLAEIRKQKFEIAKMSEILQQRDAELKKKEISVAKKEAQIAKKDNEIRRLEYQENRLNQEIDSLQESLSKNNSSEEKFQALTEKYETLQINHNLVLEKMELSIDFHAENEKLKEQAKKLIQTENLLKRFNSSFTDPVVMDWMLEFGDSQNFDIEDGWLGTTGDGPWDSEVLDERLGYLGYQPCVIPHEDVEYIVVGRKGWSKSEILAQIKVRKGRHLWIYSQEMFFAKLASGRDPFESTQAGLLDAFAKDHPALLWLLTLSEPWPNVTGAE